MPTTRKTDVPDSTGIDSAQSGSNVTGQADKTGQSAPLSTEGHTDHRAEPTTAGSVLGRDETQTYHDSMSGRPVDSTGRFTDGTPGQVAAHQIVSDTWAEDREKLDPKSPTVVQPRAVTEDQVDDNGRVQLDRDNTERDSGVSR